jgi:hypothetical protein
LQLLATRAIDSAVPSAPPDKLCFLLLKAVFNGAIAVDQLLIKQLPSNSSLAYTLPADESAALLMAHRGRADYLRIALKYVARAHTNFLQVRVGLDVDALDDYRQIMRDLPSAEFYLTPHAPVGPYVLRQQLAGLSTEDFLVFTIPTMSLPATVWRLRAEIARTGCDFVGSHMTRARSISTKRPYLFCVTRRQASLPTEEAV